MSDEITFPEKVDELTKGRTEQFLSLIKNPGFGEEKERELVDLVKLGISTKAHLYGMAALHWAAAKNYCKLITAVLDSGVDVDSKSKRDIFSATALEVAVRDGCLEAMNLLIDKGAEINSKISGMISSIVISRHFKALELLIAKGANVKEKSGWGLKVVIQRNEKDYLRLLLNNGADYSQIGWTELHLACMQGDVKAVEKIIAAGGDINAESNEDGAFSSKEEEPTFLQRLTPLKVAAIYDYPEIIKLLVKSGAPMDVCTPGWLSSVHLAAKYGSVAAIYELAHLGFDVNERENGPTPLYQIVDGRINQRCGDPIRVVRALVANGADVNLASVLNNETPLIRAINNGYDRCKVGLVSALLGCGANIYVQDYTKLNDLQWEDRENIDGLKAFYREFFLHRQPPKSVEEVYKLLAAMPSEREGQEIDPVENLRKILLYSEWDSREQALRMMERLQRRGFKVEITEVMEKVAVLRRWVDFSRDEDRGTMGRGV